MADMYVSKELVIHEELSELDFTLRDEFNYDYESEEDFSEIDVINDKKLRELRGYADTSTINIKTLEKLVKKFKKKGATHIQLFHHADHHGYEFSGFKIGLADDKLIEKYKDECEKSRKLYSEYNKLQSKLGKIRNQMEELKV